MHVTVGAERGRGMGANAMLTSYIRAAMQRATYTWLYSALHAYGPCVYRSMREPFNAGQPIVVIFDPSE